MPRPVIDLTIDLTKADSPSDSDDPGAIVSWAEPNLHAEKREVGLRPTRAMADRGSSSDSCICQIMWCVWRRRRVHLRLTYERNWIPKLTILQKVYLMTCLNVPTPAKLDLKCEPIVNWYKGQYWNVYHLCMLSFIIVIDVSLWSLIDYFLVSTISSFFISCFLISRSWFYKYPEKWSGNETKCHGLADPQDVCKKGVPWNPPRSATVRGSIGLKWLPQERIGSLIG